VQSALLEVMQERQVTIGRESYPVPDPFLVLATQNPIETEGTYPLPEAQVDRFMFKVLVDYPLQQKNRDCRTNDRCCKPHKVLTTGFLTCNVKPTGFTLTRH
jgi:MoxR-like ATPase